MAAPFSAARVSEAEDCTEERARCPAASSAARGRSSARSSGRAGGAPEETSPREKLWAFRGLSDEGGWLPRTLTGEWATYPPPGVRHAGMTAAGAAAASAEIVATAALVAVGRVAKALIGRAGGPLTLSTLIHDLACLRIDMELESLAIPISGACLVAPVFAFDLLDIPVSRRFQLFMYLRNRKPLTLARRSSATFPGKGGAQRYAAEGKRTAKSEG